VNVTKKRILLTGAGGRVGPHLLPVFADRYDLKLYDKNPIIGFENETHIGDLSDIETLKNAMEGCEAVVHLAATSDEADFVSLLVPSNVIGLYNVFEAALLAGVKRIVFASSVHTMARFSPEHPPIETTELPRPGTRYGITKVLGETMGRYYFDRDGLEFVALRFGAFEPAEKLIGHEGMQRCWLSPRDGRELIMRAIEVENVGCAIVNAFSNTPGNRFSLSSQQEVLGYTPQDSAEEAIKVMESGNEYTQSR
jgi:NAD+ dependent glucose-6-phosphate dehydrogenase